MPLGVTYAKIYKHRSSYALDYEGASRRINEKIMEQFFLKFHLICKLRNAVSTPMYMHSMGITMTMSMP